MKTEVTPEKLKEFVDELERRHVKYVVIAGLGLDGKRGHQTRPHQDLDVLCLKEDADKIRDIIQQRGYEERVFHDLHKLYGEDGMKVDLCLVTTEGEERVTYGRTVITRFPKELFEKPQNGHVGDVRFKIAPNEILKLWGCSSKYENDAAYAKTLPADEGEMKKIKRILRKDM